MKGFITPVLALLFPLPAYPQATSPQPRGGTFGAHILGSLLGYAPLNKAGDTLDAAAELHFLGLTSAKLAASRLDLTAANPVAYTPDSAQVDSTFRPAAAQAPQKTLTSIFNGKFYTQVMTPATKPAGNNAYIWSLLGAVNYQSSGGGTGQDVGVYGQGVRGAAAPQATIITTTSTTNFIPVQDTIPFQSYGGTPVSPANPMPIRIDGRRYICIGTSTASGPGTITLTEKVGAADGASGHEVVGINNPQIWGGVMEAHDVTGLPSSRTNSLLGLEVDVVANGPDDVGNRSGIVLVGGTAAGRPGPTEIATGIGVSGEQAEDSFDTIMAVAARYNTAILDFRSATPGRDAHAIWMKPGQDIVFGDSPAQSLVSDGSQLDLTGALVSHATPGWSAFNYGKNILLTASGSAHPTLGIADLHNQHLWAVSNDYGALQFAQMPAYDDTKTPPNVLLSLTSAGIRLGTGAPLATDASAGFAFLPTLAGPPTGAVGEAGAAAVVVDTKGDRLCWSVGKGIWKCAYGR